MTRILRDVYENEYAILRAHNESCRRQYRLTFTRWADTLGTEPTLDHLDPLVVQTYIATRRAEWSAATAKKDRNQISALWSYCAKRRYVDQFPTLAQIRAPGRIPRGYTVEEVSALLRQALQARPRIKPTPVPPQQFFPASDRPELSVDLTLRQNASIRIPGSRGALSTMPTSSSCRRASASTASCSRSWCGCGRAATS